ncbi:MAG: twin-arginine translocase TatA/TatE family subunit [Nitrospinaceae bacterium]|nr:twin-arginine translocase TatA/TatE family subunit [Nitrospinaceae bacterium]NIR54817.1 twin-arginine translocase TatA/TatE family subunit [Nitrospinaceae bacterium]NIS85242.1 twin-arginine translocase TatA/TatE family subunit [Nitrospinaceae bacterium]NIT82055.1 twin-arginine translocase TatA/TatE family subunit [Nitrospinaceae bacterium]NIU44316.1 twin-arginine translocase TatA/TatE family subunit [Nitrospinaceae bacterium]
MMGIGFPELMVILVIIMIIFGAGKLPEIGSAFGRSIKNFKQSMKEAEQEESNEETAQIDNAEEAPAPSQLTSETSAVASEPVAAPAEKPQPAAPPASQPAAPQAQKSGQPQTAQAKPKPKGDRVKSEEEEMIENAIKELKENRIGTIRTPHDGLVQQNDVFTQSVKRNPWGRRRDRGVRRDVI